jgi:acrylyl-CoA reductase (NADPH)
MMEPISYRALVVRENSEKTFTRAIEDLTTAALPAGDVLVKVNYSSLNYKDALSSTGNRGVTRNYPHTPGIDAAGIVAADTSGTFDEGEEVIVTSYDLGMNTSGGFGQYIRVPAGWVVKKPAGITLREAMIYGTAGFTAGLSVHRLGTLGVTPDKGEILVTGASGGVGSIAVSILAKLGYSVTAMQGLADETDFLKSIGAKNIISPEVTTENASRPMLKENYAGCIDTVGGGILAFCIKSTRANGAVTCCGNAASPDLTLTVFPFILRGVTLSGIDSQNCPMDHRTEVWDLLAGEWKFPWLEKTVSISSLQNIETEIDSMLKGRHKGRTIVSLWE